jgi:hypothetical protein
MLFLKNQCINPWYADFVSELDISYKLELLLIWTNRSYQPEKLYANGDVYISLPINDSAPPELLHYVFIMSLIDSPASSELCYSI